MSLRTRGVAVAVSARQTACGKRAAHLRPAGDIRGENRGPIRRCSGLRRWSGSRAGTASSRSNRRGRQQGLRGHVQQLDLAPLRTCAMFCLVFFHRERAVEQQRPARPARASCSTWSFISEISGETTTVEPGKMQGRDLVAQRFAAAGGLESNERLGALL